MNDKKLYIKKNWGKTSIVDMANVINLKDILEIAYKLHLYKKKTPNIGRTWTKEEIDFLKKHADHLSVREASNLLYRSYYATYQKVRVLGLGELMINKK